MNVNFSENLTEYPVTNNINIFCNLLNASPQFALFSDFTSSASSLPAFLNSIMESRKSFRTSPCFSLEQSNRY
jgi:hypothetical protein